MKISLRKIANLVIPVLILAGIYLVIRNSALTDLFTSTQSLALEVRKLGALGPLLIVALMALAIILNPLPSAPIALTAGVLYGHYLGTVYIVAGAELGAITAFLIARTAGRDLVRKQLAGASPLGRFGSQNALTGIVFVSRLLPFMSFDLISYAAGLTPLRLWRFALATLIGLIPISFLLAHMGDEIAASDMPGMTLIILVAGLLIAIPVLIAAARRRYRGNRDIKHEVSP